MTSITMIIRLLTSLALLLQSSQGFPNAPGSCNSPDPTAGSSHGISAPGTLSSFNVRVNVGGKALSTTTKATVDTGKDLAVNVTSSGSFRGFLVKLYKSGVDTSTFLKLPSSSSSNVQVLSLCTNLKAASLAHTNNNLKTAIAGTLRINSAVSDLIMEVTIVVRNSNGVSQYYTSAFALDAKAPAATGGGFCFPGKATVQTKDRGVISMNHLQLGDSVLVDPKKNKFESVYSFGHINSQTLAEYIQLKTTSTRLELSKDHMVFVDANRAVPASYIKVGDTVVVAGPAASNATTLETVQSIQTVTRQGVYAPFTPSGSIIVNGVKASSFVAFQDSPVFKLGGVLPVPGFSYQWLAHTFELPHRLWCSSISPDGCKNEQYDEQGVSTWVAVPHAAARWFLEQDMMTMMMLSIPIAVVYGMLWALGMMMTYPIMTMIFVVVGAHAAWSSVRRVKTV